MATERSFSWEAVRERSCPFIPIQQQYYEYMELYPTPPYTFKVYKRTTFLLSQANKEWNPWKWSGNNRQNNSCMRNWNRKGSGKLHVEKRCEAFSCNVLTAERKGRPVTRNNLSRWIYLTGGNVDARFVLRLLCQCRDWMQTRQHWFDSLQLQASFLLHCIHTSSWSSPESTYVSFMACGK
jgi:hypothetical protein